MISEMSLTDALVETGLVFFPVYFLLLLIRFNIRFALWYFFFSTRTHVALLIAKHREP